MICDLHSLARSLRDERGSVSIEFLLMTPILAFAAMGMLVFFDAQRSQSRDLKAALTIADMVSRERDQVGASYIDGAYELQKLVNLHDKTPELRITLLRYSTRDDSGANPADPHFHVVWSKTRGAKFSPFTDAMVDGYMEHLPIMTDEDRLIVVETEIDYAEPLGVGLKTSEFNTFTFANPRHVRVCYNDTPDNAASDLC